MNSDRAFRQSERVIETGPFDKFAVEIERDPLMVLLARWRRAAVINALKDRPDVVEVIPSGNLARGTHLGPIHDVDLIVVFDKGMHPDWHGSGSAQAALEHTQAAIRETLQIGLERPLGLVHDTELRNHVVKSDLDPSLGPLDDIIPDAPPVDVMPAVRDGSHLRVPERLSDRWIDVDPEWLMKMVAARQRAWSNFDEVVRMIKDWADHHGLKMKNLAVEVLVLGYLPKPGLFETMSSGDAVARFFGAASRAHITRLVDPAGRSGEIDPHMNYARLRKALDESAYLARQAVDTERAWKNRHLAQEGVTHPSVFWQQIFGKDRFKRPRVWYWYPPSPAEQPSAESRYWFDEFAEPADESAWSWKPWHNEPPRPDPEDRATPGSPPLESHSTDALGQAIEPGPDDRNRAEPASIEGIPGSYARERSSGSTLPISIYLSDEHIHEEVEAAIDEWLAHAGLAVEERDEPVIGSWFQRLRAGLGQAMHSPAAAEAALTALHAADSRLLLPQDAMVTATLLQNLGPVIASLQPTKDAVLRVGALLIVKVDWAVQVFQLTATQQAILDHRPRLASSPREIIAALQLSGPSGTGGDAVGGVRT